ncbi:helicase-associated domain-containing protein [Paenibacillus sp. 2TAB23]|uniref:helicase-associated domain-containing protein n=1 Tax=Paenibacillus sp. 2TAB23 TaxID=3233004 RepID=UPI003F9C8613
MRMKQLLSKLSPERLEGYLQTPVWIEAKHKGIAWQKAAVSQDAIQEATGKLTDYGLEVIKFFIRKYAAAPVEREQLVKMLRAGTSLSGAECQLGISELEEAGILLSVKKVWGESHYFMAAECFIVWQTVLFPYKPKPLSTEEKDRLASGSMYAYQRPFGRQLLSAFAELGRSGLGLTVHGVLPKKTIAKLDHIVSIEERVLSAFQLKWAHPDAYPLPVAFILQAGAALGVLSNESGSMIWNAGKLQQWLQLSRASREGQLMNWSIELLVPAGGESANCAAAMLDLQPGVWYSNMGLDSWLADSEFAPASEKWCKLWQSMGWLDVMESRRVNGTELFFRWKEEAPLRSHQLEQTLEDEACLSVLPSGEIIADPECSFTVRWELELIAEKKSEEQAAVYRLEAASIARAIERGRTRASIQRFLEGAAGMEKLPPTVEALLETWSSRAGRTVFAEVLLLRCEDEQVAALISNDRHLAPFLKQKLGLTDFIVEQSQLSEIRRLLQKAGYPARKTIMSEKDLEKGLHAYPAFMEQLERESESDIPISEERYDETPLFIYEPYPLHHFELNAHMEKESLHAWSQLDRVPAMWTKQLRAYHHSTRRELIEQALQWQTPIQLRMERGLFAFVPEKLEQQGNGWAVIGLLRDEPRETIRLTPDMWGEMRLLIPGQESQI